MSCLTTKLTLSNRTRAGLLAVAQTLSLVFLHVHPTTAAEQKSFPYEAVVSAKELYVRSGPEDGVEGFDR